ncbi:glycosyltransferase family 4 protein [Rhodococcus sp. F64268]|uniref:glycosyltransferase family 4 protein n=1 Tax=Rhodococcus sp. F64268 TaxID=2926402 RepID=UPI0035B380FE
MSGISGGAIDFVYDERDNVEVRRAISEEDWAETVSLHPVSLSDRAFKTYGDSRTRTSYLRWIPRAKAVMGELVRLNNYSAAHQFTFATASLPPLLPRISGPRVWGPVAVPHKPVHEWNGRSSLRERTSVVAGKANSQLFSRSADRIVCQNDATFDFMRRSGAEVVLEPNIVVEPRARLEHDPRRLVLSGGLINRKRPWLAVEALNSPALRDYRLDILGDGPLRKDLESYVRLERLSSRVTFHGRVSHASAIEYVATAGALLLPSRREGAPWVVGEAAACGTPSVVFSDSGAATIVRLSGNLGAVVASSADRGSNINRFRNGIFEVGESSNWQPTRRWSRTRLGPFLRNIWS